MANTGLRLSLLVACVLLTTGVTAIAIEDFYPFGSEAGDSAVRRIDDGSSPPLTLPSPFNFFGLSFNEIFINSNGHITPGAANSQYTPTQFPLPYPMIAMYWADVDISPDDGGNIWYRITNDSTILQRALTDIQSAYPFVSYVDYICIATWDHVGYYNQHTDKTNTFQCVLVKSGNQFYAIYLYADGLIQWTTGDANGGENGLGGYPLPLAGYNAGDGITSYTVPGSLTENIVQSVTLSNVCVPGLWVFRLDEDNVVLKCYQRDFRILALYGRLYCV